MDIILQFRVRKVALAAKGVPHGVGSRKGQLRFLWIDNITKDDPKIIPLRFKRVVFGVSSSSLLLRFGTISRSTFQISRQESHVRSTSTMWLMVMSMKMEVYQLYEVYTDVRWVQPEKIRD